MESRNADDDKFMPLSIDGYREWTLTNPEPFRTDPHPSPGLCRASPEEQVEWSFRNNPHYGRMDSPKLAENEDPFKTHTAYLKIYVNKLGANAVLNDPSGKCPEGTIIVKEKWMDPNIDAQPKLMTVMRKRESGYNPDCGDWEFAQFDGDGERIIAQGRLESCMNCHVPKSEIGLFVPLVY